MYIIPFLLNAFFFAFVGETTVQPLRFFLIMAGQAERAQIIKAAFAAANRLMNDYFKAAH